MQLSFENKTVLVTGAARGIGSGIVAAFAASGAHIIATDVLAKELSATAAQIPCEHGGKIEVRELDVCNADQVTALVRDIEKTAKQIDVLVHAAGGILGQTRKPIEEISEQDWDAIYQVNVKGAFLLCRAVAPAMKKARSGRIVVIASRAGLGVSLTGIPSYGTAKTAQIGMVRQLAQELGEFGITINAVAPGFLRTSPDYERQWASYGEAGQQAMIDRIAMRRLGEPKDIAAAVLFLASEHASWITGQALPVTGGPL